MPPEALISFTASFTPSLKFVPDVVPVPDSSINPKILIGPVCASSGWANAKLSRRAEMRAMERIGVGLGVVVVRRHWDAGASRNSRPERPSGGSANAVHRYRKYLSYAAGHWQGMARPRHAPVRRSTTNATRASPPARVPGGCRPGQRQPCGRHLVPRPVGGI